MIIDQAVYEHGVRRPCGDLSDELAALRSAGDPTAYVWIGLKNPTEAEFALVSDELDLHALAIEDAVNGRQRPKIEIYEGTTFVVLKPLRYIEATSDIETGEIMIFIGDHFIVTVRRGEASPLADIRHRLEGDTEQLSLGPMGVFHAIADNVVDTYRVIDEEIAADLDAIETAVFGGAGVTSEAIYRLKREVLEFRRAAVPLSVPLQALHRGHQGPMEEEIRLLFRDVADHLHGVIDHVESYDRLLTDVLHAHLAQISVQQNSDMRKISAWVAIAAVPTMIAGVYGMNFEHMPELSWRFGYAAVLGLMAGICLLMYRAFRRSRWL
ncbi:MAG: magnesium/cobalt transporter CorA [Tetrasphaera sp.]|nr:magnesium/cobalt transporter CorA [Tetrasphaera sp.]